MSSPFVIVTNLLKTFTGHTAVNNVSFEISEGIIFGLLGPNGAGKSTVISMMSGLFPPDDGDITIGGYSILQEPGKAKSLMGVVPQEIALYPTLSARENLMFWGRLYGMNGKSLQKKVDEALELVGLTQRSNEQIEKYSGGMKRRVNIAAGLLHNPQLLLLDEPTVGVDPQSRRSILETIKELNRQGMTVVYTSHYMEEVEEICHYITIMDRGEIIASGTKTDLMQLVGNTDLVKLEMNRPMEDLGSISKMPAVKAVSLEGSTLQVTVSDSSRALAAIIADITGKGLQVSSVKVDKPNLETVFLHLTGRTLRN